MNGMVPRGESALLARLRDALDGPLSHIDFEELARYNHGYLRYQADPFGSFVLSEWPYYRAVLRWYRSHVPVGAHVLDVGTLIPTVPLLLAWQGYRVTTVERLELYGRGLDPLVDVAQREGVNFLDLDLTTTDLPVRDFDVANLLAVIEHLPGSPRNLLQRVYNALRDGGRIVVVVPNHARLMHRLQLLRGRSVHQAYSTYFDSAYPFTGHHREYTSAELVYALEHSGYTVERIAGVPYPPQGSLGARCLARVAALLPDTFHTALLAVGRRA